MGTQVVMGIGQPDNGNRRGGFAFVRRDQPHPENKAAFDDAYREVLHQMPKVAQGPMLRSHANKLLGVQTAMDEPNSRRDLGLHILKPGQCHTAAAVPSVPKQAVQLFPFMMPNAVAHAIS